VRGINARKASGGVGETRQERGRSTGQLLVFVKNTVPSLSVLLAAGAIAASRRFSVQVVHVATDLDWRDRALQALCAQLAVCAAVEVPYHLVEDAMLHEQLALTAKVRTILSIYEDLEWTFVSVRGTLRQSALLAIRSGNPAAIVVGAQTPRGRMRPSFSQWLAARTRVPITVIT
jgi:hypothetical protein